MEKQFNTFNDVAKYLCSIPNINQGGCGFSAYAMKLWMNQHFPDEQVEVHFMYKGNYKSLYEENQSFLAGQDRYATSCSHAFIWMKGKYYDCTGLRDDLALSYPFVHTTTNELIETALGNAGMWNDDFNRDNVARIEQTLGISFNVKIPIRDPKPVKNSYWQILKKRFGC